ncbi:MAG: restriction endonuclease subunit S [Alphaproteobacteria bacterium]|nr:restriction endonuclease subunit S [Burkholderiaceae bacterium]MBY0292122.1 restriction endonuclease subunit S [Alphaproteobacteria bacterium]
MSRYRAYAEYKDSEAIWFGNIPKHWNESRLKFEASINMGQSPNSEDCNQDGVGMPFLQGNAEFGAKNPAPKQYCVVPRKIANPGELLFSVRAPVGALNIADQRYGIGRGLCSILNREKLDRNFLWWLVIVIKGELDSVSTGSTFEAVSAEQVGNVLVFCPPVAEQEKIANFLDHETAKIDTLIAKQQELIKLLKEKRQTVISHAVTKGLNPNAPMRESGVEWLGEVPAHWSVSSIGYHAQISTGATPDRTNSEYWNGNIPWIKTGEVRYDEIFETEEYITELAISNSSVKISPPGTLLMAMYGQGVTRGRVAILGVPATYNQACAAIYASERFFNQYLRYYFMAAYHAIRDGGNETSQMNLNADIVGKFKVTIPYIEEQYQIVEFLDKSLKKLDILLERALSAIEFIQERRTALISASVTGKIDVRDWQPTLVPEIEVAAA